MKSTMKIKPTVISIATVLTFVMISLFAFTTSGSAASATLDFPTGPNKSVGKTFEAPRGSTVNVAVRLKNNGVPDANAAKNSNGPKRLTASLFKPDGSVFGVKEELVSPGQTKTVQFGGKFTEGSSCGNWKVEVSNPNDDATKATATITVDFSFVPMPIIKTYPPISIPQNTTQTVAIAIPQAGDLTVTARWYDTIPVTFILKKGKGTNPPIAVAPLPAPPSELKLKYKVTQKDIDAYGTLWRLEVAAAGTVQWFTPTSVLTPGCY